MKYIKQKLAQWKAQIALALCRSLIASEKEKIAWSIYDKLTGSRPDMPLSTSRELDHWTGIALHHAKDSREWESAYNRACKELSTQSKMLAELSALFPVPRGVEKINLGGVIERIKWLQEQQAARGATKGKTTK